MSKNKKKFKVDISEIWPQERGYIEKPERYKYVRKIIKPDGCVFCSAAESKSTPKSLLLAKRKHSMVVLNKFPYNSGHVLVLPTRHCGQILELKKVEYNELMDSLRETVAIIQQVFGINDMNLGMNHGAVAGAGIPEHLHWHIIPRWFGDTNFFPLIAETKVHAESLEQVFKKLRPKFKKMGW